MIYIKHSSLLDTPADIIVCPVSRDGIVGYGLIKDIFYKYPDMHSSYIAMSRLNKKVSIVYDRDTEQRICFFVTKNKATEPANIDCIAESLNGFVKYKIPLDAVVAFPELGYGEVDWFDVEQLMYQYLDAIPQKVYLCKNKEDRVKSTNNEKE